MLHSALGRMRAATALACIRSRPSTSFALRVRNKGTVAQQHNKSSCGQFQVNYQAGSAAAGSGDVYRMGLYATYKALRHVVADYPSLFAAYNLTIAPGHPKSYMYLATYTYLATAVYEHDELQEDHVSALTAGHGTINAFVKQQWPLPTHEDLCAFTREHPLMVVDAIELDPFWLSVIRGVEKELGAGFLSSDAKIVDGFLRLQKYYEFERAWGSLGHLSPEHIGRGPALDQIAYAQHLRSGDLTILTRLLSKVSSLKEAELLRRAQASVWKFIDVQDDILGTGFTSYHGDILKNSFNVYRFLVRLYGERAPPILRATLELHKQESLRLHNELPLELKQLNQSLIDHMMGDFPFEVPEPILDEVAFASKHREAVDATAKV